MYLTVLSELGLSVILQFQLVTVMMVREMKVGDTSFLTGKALIYMNTNFRRSILTCFVIHLKVILVRMDRSLYFIACTCLSISGTCSLVAVGLIFNTRK